MNHYSMQVLATSEPALVPTGLWPPGAAALLDVVPQALRCDPPNSLDCCAIDRVPP